MPGESSTLQFKWWHLTPDSFEFDPTRGLWKTKPGLGKTAVADLRKVPRDGELSEWSGQAWVRPDADDGEDLSMVLLPPGAKIEQPLKRTAHVADGHRSTSLRIHADSSSEDED